MEALEEAAKEKVALNTSVGRSVCRHIRRTTHEGKCFGLPGSLLSKWRKTIEEESRFLSFIPFHEEQRQAELCELQASLVTIVSSRPVRAEKTLSQAKKQQQRKIRNENICL